MKKPKYKIRRLWYRFIYRMLRKDMVARMLNDGFTWTKINTVLMAFNQDIVTHYQNNPEKKGIEIHFGKVDMKKMIDNTLKQKHLFDRLAGLNRKK